jgi:hypothetical protein
MEPGIVNIRLFGSYSEYYGLKLKAKLHLVSRISKLFLASHLLHVYEKMFNCEDSKNIVDNKIVLEIYNDHVKKIISYFGKVESILWISESDVPDFPKEIKIYYDNKSSGDKLFINLKKPYNQEAPIPSYINHLSITLGEFATEDILTEILSHPVDRINLHYKDIDLPFLVNLLVSHPARHIYITRANFQKSEIEALVNKPGIISLRISSQNSWHELPSFEENYTILRFYHCQDWNKMVLPQEIYDRNLEYSRNLRFARTKVATA